MKAVAAIALVSITGVWAFTPPFPSSPVLRRLGQTHATIEAPTSFDLKSYLKEKCAAVEVVSINCLPSRAVYAREIFLVARPLPISC